VRNSPIRLIVTEANRGGGVTEVDVHPAWGDPFVEEWKAFYENVSKKRAPKTDPADFIHDLELFAEMARQMREP
jgi:predicted dehydrogenase